MVQTLALVNIDDLRVLMSEQAIKNEVWGTEEASEYLKCSPSHLKNLANKGEVPAVRFGNNWKFSSIALYEHVARKNKGAD